MVNRLSRRIGKRSFNFLGDDAGVEFAEEGREKRTFTMLGCVVWGIQRRAAWDNVWVLEVSGWDEGDGTV